MKKLFKDKDLCKKLLWTLFVFLIYRFGCSLAIPGISSVGLKFSADSLFALMNVLGGGALSKFSIFALGVGPYITASIVVELLAVGVVPAFTEWKNDGVKGAQKTERATRFLGFGLAILQAFFITYGFDKQYGIMKSTSAGSYIFVIMMLTAGAMLMIWLGDLITKKGVGNGLSMLIFAGIISSMPATFVETFETLIPGLKGSKLAHGVVEFILFILFYLLLIFLVTKVETAERRVPIQANGTFATGSNMSFMPIRVNSASVIPVIFAQTLLTVPQTIASFISTKAYTKVSAFLSLGSARGLILYGVMTFLFTFMYTDIILDPEEIADNFKKQGTFIPGVRPGKDTEKILGRIILSTTFTGAVCLTVIALLPYLLAKFTSLSTVAALGGTGIIVAVGVAIETIETIESKLTTDKYKNYGGWFH